MTDNAFLLDDAQMQQFITDGYITVQADYPPEFHQDIYQQIEAMFEAEGNTGNNILPRIPQIQKVFDHPALKGALTSLLGEGLHHESSPALPSQSARQQRSALA